MGVTSGVGVIVKPRRRFCAEADTFFSIGRDFVVVADDGENEWEMVEEGVRPWVSCSDWFTCAEEDGSGGGVAETEGARARREGEVRAQHIHLFMPNSFSVISCKTTSISILSVIVESEGGGYGTPGRPAAMESYKIKRSGSVAGPSTSSADPPSMSPSTSPPRSESHVHILAGNSSPTSSRPGTNHG